MTISSFEIEDYDSGWTIQTNKLTPLGFSHKIKSDKIYCENDYFTPDTTKNFEIKQQF